MPIDERLEHRGQTDLADCVESVAQVVEVGIRAALHRLVDQLLLENFKFFLFERSKLRFSNFKLVFFSSLNIFNEKDMIIIFKMFYREL